MSEETVEHRFVQIHQAYEKVSLKSDEFWGSLSRASTIAVSHSCEKIYYRVVLKKDLDCLNAIQNLQNLILTSNDDIKDKVYLRTLTRLLMYNQHVSDKIQFHHSKVESRQVHPFALITRQKPTLYFSILDQIDLIFVRDAEMAIEVIKEFVKSVFLIENNVDASALLVRLSNAPSNITDDIYELISSLVVHYPMQRDSIHYLSLVDLLLSSRFLDKLSVNTSYHYVYAFLDRLVTICSQGRPIVSYLVRFQRMLDMLLHNIHADLVWVSLSFLLLKAQTLEEQEIIMICKRIIMTSGRLGNFDVLRVAYLPLYQLLSELNDKEASQELKELKEYALSLISHLDQDQPKVNHKEAQDQLQTICQDHTIYGLLSHILVYLAKLYSGSAPTEDNDYNMGSENTLALNMLFSTPFVFKSDAVQDIYSVYFRLTILSTEQKTCYKFPMLLFLLRMLRAVYQDARLVAHIFRDVIPSLADANDPTITSKILQVILSSIQNSGGADSTMASLGVKALAHTHQRQPRVWQELKKVFSEWVLRRKSGTVRRKIDLAVTGPIKMELTVLSTMRDVCKERPQECAPDVLPMVISLLQTCQDLSMASLSLILSTVNYCVKAGLVEPRSIWNVAIVYLAQFAFEQGTQKSALLVQQLCKFYSIAGAKQDTSEPYLQFKENLLVEYILPLINSNDTEAASQAMIALADFSAQDMASILPEKAGDYVAKACNKPIRHQDLVLAALMSNELDHMRRGLFKEETTSTIKQPVATEKKSITVNEAGQAVGEREMDLQTKFVSLWEDARVAPGLRSGYAIALLHTLDQPTTKEAQTTLEIISKTKWYRFMITSFTDVSLTDHLLLRVSSIGSWEAFFKHALADAESDMETIVGVLLKDLLSRLERSTVPGVTCNIFIAMIGLVYVTRMYIPSFAFICANDVIQVLMTNYIALSGSPLSHSAHLMSEEVQFAARFALGHFAPFVISNEKSSEMVFNVLMDAAVNTNNKFRSIDTAVDLVQFANGYAAGHFSASLATYPTPTPLVESMKTNSLQMLLGYCSSQPASDSRIIGILMGLASKLSPEVMGDELAFAKAGLQAYLLGESISKGRLLGSTWLCAVGALQEDHVDYELSALVESIVAAASNDSSLSQHFYHFTVPYTQIQQHSYLCADTNDEETTEQFYKQAFDPLLTSIDNDDASSNYRIASLFGLGSLLGVNYLNTTTKSIYLQAQRYHVSSRRIALDKLTTVAGLTVRSAPTGNLKSGRVAAAVCGKVIEHAQCMQRSLGKLETDDFAAIASSSISSSEPASYNRLNSNTSYLRAVFDHLATANEEAAILLLNSLIQTPGPLPPVNWFTILMKWTKSLPRLCLGFASKHAATSFSLTEFLITQMMAMIKKGDMECKFLFTIDGAFDTILELTGLAEKKTDRIRRGMNAVVKKTALSESRLMELLELCQKSNMSILNWTLHSLSQYLPSPFEEGSLDEDKVKLASSIRQFFYQSVMVEFFENGRSQDLSINDAVKCSITDLDQIFPTIRLIDWNQFSTQAVINRVTVLCALLREAPINKKQAIVKYISTSMAYLIGCETSDEIIETWQDINETVCEDVCGDNKKAMAWIIRILDAFVVHMGAFDDSSIFDDQAVAEAICYGLRETLIFIQAIPFEFISLSQDVQLADTVCQLDYYLNLQGDFKTEQEQITKRIFTLLDMSRKLQAEITADFFYRLTLGLPQDYVLQYEARY